MQPKTLNADGPYLRSATGPIGVRSSDRGAGSETRRCKLRTVAGIGALSAALLLSTLSGCTTSTGSRSGGNSSAQDNEELTTEEFTLDNGMRLVIHEDHRVPNVKLSIRVGVGSADEPPGRGGFAHLFEHLMFMGTKAAPNFFARGITFSKRSSPSSRFIELIMDFP